jgi:hypothetical protein
MSLLSAKKGSLSILENGARDLDASALPVGAPPPPPFGALRNRGPECANSPIMMSFDQDNKAAMRAGQPTETYFRHRAAASPASTEPCRCCRPSLDARGLMKNAAKNAGNRASPDPTRSQPSVTSNLDVMIEMASRTTWPSRLQPQRHRCGPSGAADDGRVTESR